MECNVPVVLLLFKREEAALKIIKRLREAHVKKIYIMADYGRDKEEIEKVKKTRIAVENAIDWDCEVIKNYAEKNRGVYGNIALGAKWVFEREKCAIFLEDDNLPEVSFFRFCEELLKKYENDNRILWICGTNYLGKYKSQFDSSYVFTKHMLPCGWASWSDKFLKYYDGYAEVLNDPAVARRFVDDFPNKTLANTYYSKLLQYKKEISEGKQPNSWDYQMSLSLRTNNMLGISPVCNQIKNIGVDLNSEHGGNSMLKIMTRRFCGMDSYRLEFPLKHPKCVMTELKYENAIDKIVTPPWQLQLRHIIAKNIKKLLGMEQNKSLLHRKGKN